MTESTPGAQAKTTLPTPKPNLPGAPAINPPQAVADKVAFPGSTAEFILFLKILYVVASPLFIWVFAHQLMHWQHNLLTLKDQTQTWDFLKKCVELTAGLVWPGTMLCGFFGATYLIFQHLDGLVLLFGGSQLVAWIITSAGYTLNGFIAYLKLDQVQKAQTKSS